MFCNNCGKQLEDGANFCPSCGTAAGQAEAPKTTINDNEVILTIKPKFIGFLIWMKIIPSTLFLSFWCGGFLGGLSQMFFGNHHELNPIPFLVFGILPLIIIPPATYFIALGKNKNTIYHFYKTKVEYHEGFLGRDSKTLSYNKILETELNKGIFEQHFGIGTVFLSTSGVSMKETMGGNGITMTNIPNPDENYKLIKDLIDKSH